MAGLDLGTNIQDVYTQQDRDAMMDPTTPIEAAFDLSWEQTPVGALARIMAQNEADNAGGTKLMPGDLNEMFPDMPEKFSEPTSLRVAQLMSDRNDERRRLQNAIANGPKDLLNGTATFAASLLPHVIDPISVAAGFATGGLSSYFLGARALGTAGTLAVGVAENLAANLALEPLVIAANRMDNTPYTVMDSFENTIAPAVAFPVIGMAGKKLLRYAGLLDPVSGGAVHTASIGRMAEGRDPILGARLMAKQLVRETSGTEFKPYEFRALDMSVPNTRPFYAASIDTGEKGLIGEFMGGALYLSDNANVANGTAARSGSRTVGEVFEMNLERAKLADLSGQVPEDIMQMAKQVLGQEARVSMTGPDLIELLVRSADDGNEGLFQKFQQGVKDLGYDGVAYRMDKYLGEVHPAHNVVALFNPEKAVEKFKQPASRDFVPRLTKEELGEFTNARTDNDLNLKDQAFVQDPEGIKEVMEYANVRTSNLEEKVAQIKSESKLFMEDLTEMEKIGSLDGAELKQFEEIKRLASRQEKLPVATAQALACVRGA